MMARRFQIPTTLTLAALAAVGMTAACTQLEGRLAGETSVPPATTATAPAELPGLHNVVAYGADLFSGGAPQGTVGLDALAELGIKTVVSVDGAMPDVDYAQSRGLRYIHLPISYDGVTEERRKQYAQILYNSPRPIYMHCHHGKHRSASALGTGAVTAGLLTVAQAEERMLVSGTSPNYPRLWESLRACRPLPAAELESDLREFVSRAKVTGLVEAMANIDVVFDNLKVLQQADWSAPTDHPDLVAPNESQRLHTLFQDLVDDPESQKLPAHYQGQLQRAISDAAALDAAVRRKDFAEAARLFATVKKGCKTCHADYRNR